MKDQPELSGMCATCHTPLRDQWTDAYLQADGVGCSGCHSRASQKFGPPPRPTTIAPLVARYPAPHGAVCAALLPHAMDINLAALRQRLPQHPALARLGEIARLLTGRPHATAEDGTQPYTNMHALVHRLLHLKDQAA